MSKVTNIVVELGPAIRENKCPAHYWIVDSNNVGKCRRCGEVRDFGRLLQRAGVFAAAGRRGAKASKGVARRPYGRGGEKRESATNVKISAAAKKRWQNPEYRAKMSGRKGRNLKYE